MQVSTERFYPDRLEVAGRFITDARDYFIRFRCTFYSAEYDFQSIKSRRAKAFIDLRLALECSLKGYIAIRQPYSSGGEKLVRQVELNRHNIEKLYNTACKLWRIKLPDDTSTVILDCSQLNIGIRYSFDAFDFLWHQEKLYYKTIGSDYWINQLKDIVEALISHQGKAMQRRIRVVSAADIPLDQLMGKNTYRRYWKPKDS